MSTIILAFIVLLIIVMAMSIGVIMGRKPISGSCGGLANVGIDSSCEICGGDPKKCDEEQDKQAVTGDELAYEVKAKE